MVTYLARWFARRKTVTHPSTNRARRILTSLIRPTLLLLSQTATRGNVILEHVICLFQAFILRLYIWGAVYSQTQRKQRNARNARKNQNMLLSACVGRFFGACVAFNFTQAPCVRCVSLAGNSPLILYSVDIIDTKIKLCAPFDACFMLWMYCKYAVWYTWLIVVKRHNSMRTRMTFGSDWLS